MTGNQLASIIWDFKVERKKQEFLDEQQKLINNLFKERENLISIDEVIEWLKEKDIIKMSWQEENARKELQEYIKQCRS